jgi:hypothetical protein
MIAFLVPSAALAKGACQEEKTKFCAKAEDIGLCLSQHSSELSDACKAEIETREKSK